MNKENKNSKGLLRALLSKNELGALLPLALLLIVVAFVNPNFFVHRNILDILRTASFTFIVAMPLTFLLASQGLDLSVGAVTSLGGIICGMALKAGFPLPLAILAALLSGALVGTINGIFAIRSNLPVFIATLGTQYMVNGFITITTNNVAISNFDTSFKQLSQYRLFGEVPMPILYAVILAIIGQIVLSKTRYGREVLAIGGNRETAYLAGIKVNQRRMITFIATSVFSALAGVLTASRFACAQPAAGSGTELSIMAGVIIGGTSMFGGQATVIGSALGAILLATITNALILMNVSTLWQAFIYGFILIVALYVDKYRRKVLSGEK